MPGTNRILWIARRDGKGWNSSRTRGAVDLGFTVYRDSNDNDVYVEVRMANSGHARSRAGRGG